MFQYEMHTHTAEMGGCGKIPAAETVRRYKYESGYDGLIITDHYQPGFFIEYDYLPFEKQIDRYLKGYRVAKEEGAKIDFTIMLGIELRFKENFNDYLVYGFDENFLYDHKNICDMTIKDFKRLADDNKLLVFQAHPFRANMIPMPDCVHGIEVYNGNARHDSHNDKALNLAKEYGLLQLSSSDFHEEEDLARGGIILDKKICNITEMVNALKNNKNKLITT